jgi:hypothetical protein
MDYYVELATIIGKLANDYSSVQKTDEKASTQETEESLAYYSNKENWKS